jgi:RimJ/RimL family protein N-acetyltransferase
MFVPEARSPDDKVAFGIWADDQLVGILDLLLRYLDEETVYLGLLLVDRARQGQGIGTAARQALDREWVLAPDGLRRGRRGRPYRYDKPESEVILMDKPVAAGG